MSASTSQALSEYLTRQPGTVHNKLYRQPSTALAVFRRMLPHLAKTIVMAMLYMPGPFAVTQLDLWVRPDSQDAKTEATITLEQLHIMNKLNEPGKPTSWQLNPTFSKSLQNALVGGGNHRSFGIPCETPDEKAADVNFLDAFARKQWEAILYYMVGSTGAGIASGINITAGTQKLLEAGGFVQKRSGTITQEGFTFLLQEVNAQVWNLLIVYLEIAPTLQMEPVEVLSFLFMLGSLELGQDYSTSNLTPTQQRMLEDLNDFGLVYRRTPNSDRFYPTRLATTLTSDAGALLSTSSAFDTGLRSSSGKGYIIIETNYRLYAYTSSLLQIAVLNLFTKLTTRFPNLVSGKITKESIQRAIGTGITSDQIISYLSVHAHPQMAKTLPVLPPTVVDQIRLWQIEGDRMKTTEGYLCRDFNSREEYTRTRDYAKSLGVLKWSNDTRLMYFVSQIDQLRAYLKGDR